jgi:methionyl-tRNA formyltransferase
VKNFVRGLSPYPAAWTNLRIGDHVFENTKIFEVQLSWQPTTLCLKAADGYLDILSLQAPGKKRMNAKDFLNGLH